MAEIIPFKGIRFNTEKTGDLSQVTAPPYDVISRKERDMFYDTHPANVIRLILGKDKDTDSEKDNRHTRAFEYFTKWRQENILATDETPSIYFSAVDFDLDGRVVTRFGMTAMAKIEPFDKGIILPHEKTFSKVKSERLELMKACRANFSPIFSVYRDKDHSLASFREEVMKKTPDSDFKDGFGHRHRMWRVTDPSAHETIRASMKDNAIFIADGHHRYETALNYRNFLADTDPDFHDGSGARYIMMYLCAMDDPGLIILPAHRLLSGIDPDLLHSLPERAKAHFDVEAVPFDSSDVAAGAAGFESMLKAREDRNAIGVSIRGAREFYLLTLKPGEMERAFGDSIPPSLIRLDVTVLTRLVMMRLLGFDKETLDNEQMIRYSSRTRGAVEAVLNEKCDVAFILNPTRMSQVREVAREGLIMPRKSTYFYPKVITGQVMRALD
ncbi:conserved hypothetical protein [Candidatus Desulfarcum epimagneticum]|uniref:DUF1015 domain-containing protein n=1 Tax=uncultured Desulfobacteraceae bacterium TaxID=218296 RepID=A0A484HE13_9BACT|nr:conserved hypothetical protein [uncultured Desulfobacteraceae bacterium]